MEIREVIEVSLLLVGSALILLAAVGIFRMPDLIIRLHSTSKAATLGSALMLCAVAVHFESVAVATRVFAVVVFLFITAPVAAHMLARASYFLGVPLWDQTVTDELAGAYDRDTHVLAGSNEPGTNEGDSAAQAGEPSPPGH